MRGAANRRRHGVEVLTLFAFSSENWGRPQPARALLACCRATCAAKSGTAQDGIRLRFIGSATAFSELRRLMLHRSNLTAGNTSATVVIAVDYGGHGISPRLRRNWRSVCWRAA